MHRQSGCVSSQTPQSYFPRKWSQQEFTLLSRIVKEVKPENNKGWSEVCMRMHAIGSRRSASDYRTKFNKNTAKQQRNVLKQNTNITEAICRLFQEGNSPSQISKALEFSQFDRFRTVKNIEIILKEILAGINKVMQKILGKSNIYSLKPKDYQLFQFMRQSGIKIVSLTKVDNNCKYWKGLKLQRSGLKQQNYERYQKLENKIYSRFIKFNNTLLMASSQLKETQGQKQQTDQGRSQRPKLVKRCSNKIESISSILLRGVPETLNEQKNETSYFFKDSSNYQADQLEHQISFLYKTLPRASQSQEKSQRGRDNQDKDQEGKCQQYQEQYFFKEGPTSIAIQIDPPQDDSAFFASHESYNIDSFLQ